jgi:hypothetical protein
MTPEEAQLVADTKDAYFRGQITRYEAILIFVLCGLSGAQARANLANG